MTEVLYETYPNEDEGTLSKWRSRLVSDKYLASLAHAIDLGDYMQFLLVKNVLVVIAVHPT